VLLLDSIVTEFPHLSKSDKEKGLDILQEVLEKKKVTTSDLHNALDDIEDMCPTLTKSRHVAKK